MAEISELFEARERIVSRDSAQESTLVKHSGKKALVGKVSEEKKMVSSC